MKTARWKLTNVPKAPTRTMRAALCSGAKGKGKTLGAYEFWPDSALSCAASDPIAEAIEADAIHAGYSLVFDVAEED